MIRKLRRKIVAMTMAVLMLIVTLFHATGYYVVMRACDQLADDILQNLAENATPTGETSLNIPHLSGIWKVSNQEFLSVVAMPVYLVEVDSKGTLESVTCTAESEALPEKVLAAVLSDPRPSGSGSCGSFQYYKAQRADGGACAAVAEGARDLRDFVRAKLGRLVLPAMVLGVAVLFALCWWLSALVVRPVEETFRRQRQFLADAGHELKTPLTAIAVNAAVLQEEVGENPSLTYIRQETSSMNSLIRRMMEIARIQEPETEEKRRRADLTELADQMVQYFQPRAEERGVTLSLEAEEGISVRGDEERLRQLMVILLANACKYAGEAGRVEVKLCRRGRRTVFEVGNTGPGISREDMPHIFNRFYRCDKSRPADGSYGLGLAIAQNIAQEQRGKLTAESVPGQWTVFRLVL